jgi:diguanylate cyclase (GGDEF)-like protein/PAS domain S-box-containing protein
VSETEENLREEIARLRKIIAALMDRAESSTNPHGSDFDGFQSALVLEEEVRVRTGQLEAALHENERITRALRESEAKYRSLVDQSLVGVVIIDEGRFAFTNPRFCEIFGYSAAELLRLGPLDVVTEQERARTARRLEQLRSGKLVREHYEVRGRRKDGQVIDIEVYGNAVDVGGRRMWINVVQDVTERARAERAVAALQAQLREQSARDPLTGLYNRRYLEEALERELIVAGRSQAPVSLVMCDIDHFKAVNDRYGHPVGDAVLRTFAQWLTRHARATDVCCRFGGEEFLLVLPGVESAMACHRAEQLRSHAVATPMELAGDRVVITASFGVATAPLDGATGAALIGNADRALYAAKNRGRNRVVDVGDL